MSRNLFCLGNALFDISAFCDSSQLHKYHLQPDENAEATEQHDQLFVDLLQNPNAFYSPGGSAQNTARVVQWMFDGLNGGQVTFVGCIGKDIYGQKLKEFMKKSHVHTIYDIHNVAPTGVSAALITNDSKRSLCARLGASSLFNPDFINNMQVQSEIEKAEIIYVEGYFLSHNPGCVLALAKSAVQTSKTFVLNLSAAYICRQEIEVLKSCVALSGIVFGNRDEAETFLDSCKMSYSSVEESALTISSLPYVQNRQRITVITQGPDPVVVAVGKSVSVCDVPFIAEITDTIGCGDAFVGGFLAAVLNNETSIDTTVQWGIYCATEIAKNRGCTLPNFSANFRI